jgi:type IV fimbrial biogenesis protein FimT
VVTVGQIQPKLLQLKCCDRLNHINRLSKRTGCSSGYTLIEMMLVVAIIGVVLSITAPSFSTFIKDNRLTRAADTYFASTIQARAAAQRSGSQVSMCKTGNIYNTPPSCNDNIHSTGNPLPAANWSHGWIIYETTGALISFNPSLGHRIVAVVETQVADKNVIINSNNDATNFVTFGADGKLDTGSPIIAICDDRNDGLHGYRMAFSATGRVTSTKFKDLPSADRDCTP